MCWAHESFLWLVGYCEGGRVKRNWRVLNCCDIRDGDNAYGIWCRLYQCGASVHLRYQI